MTDQTEKRIGHNYFIQAANSDKVLKAMAAQHWILHWLDSGDDTFVVHVIDLKKDGPPFSELKLIDGCTASD